MSSRQLKAPEGAELLAAIWACRILLHRSAESCLVRNELHDDRRIATLIGVPQTAFRRNRSLPRVVGPRLRYLEKRQLRRGVGLLRNASFLARRLNLTPVEEHILVLAVMVQSFRGFDDLFGHLGAEPLRALISRFAAALEADVAVVKRALRRDGVLQSAKLVELHRGYTGDGARVPLRRGGEEASLNATEAVVEALTSPGQSAAALMRHFLHESPRTRLSLGSFEHVEADVRLLVRLVKGALRRHARGVNVLLHGKPGTGKTELARVVAAAVGARLYEVADANADGDAVEGDHRLQMCAIAQRFLAQTRGAMLLFDEIEDAFPTRWRGSMGLDRESTATKSWTHGLLERAPLPTFWLANTIEQMDPATLRRFDLVLELGVPPRQVRRRMIATELGKRTVPDTHLDSLSADDRLAPAHVARAVRVADLMGARQPDDLGAALARVLERNLSVQGPARAALSTSLPCGPYDLALVNASADLGKIAESLSRTGQAALCLYGPPGSGKTAWVAHLAELLGRPLRAVRASDLLDCYLGGTEKNLASLFRSALAERAVLFVDEADSFLRDRGLATKSWEVTQVNELLVQMESFQGIFVCATNQIDSLDHASLRRFSLKIEFSPLRPEQRQAMFRRLGGEQDEVAERHLERLHGLTAGDFASVARQARLMGVEHPPEALVAMLERELVLRRGGCARSIGFRGQAANGAAHTGTSR